MTFVLLLIHLFVTIALIGVVLIQRSEGGGLGIGTSQGMGAFMSGRGTANLLTRTTAILGTIFFALSLTLALLNRGTGGVGRSILDTPPISAPAGAAGKPALPALPPPAPIPGADAPAASKPVAPAPGAGSATAPTPVVPAPATGNTPAPAPVAPAPATGSTATPAQPAAPAVPTN